MHFTRIAVAAALTGAKGAEGTLHGGMLRRFEDGDKGLNAARFTAVSELEFGHAAGSYSAGSSVEKPRVGRRLQGEGSEAAVLYASGRSDLGQFGGGLPMVSTKYIMPIEIDVSVFDPNDIKQSAAGYQHTLVVLHNKTAWAAGGGAYGRLCSGNEDNQATFLQIPLTGVERVAAGRYHSIIILLDGRAFGCGYNGYNQLGVTPTSNVLDPVEIPVVGVDGSAHVVDAAAGESHTLFLTQEGQCFSTGYNLYGQLCLGDTNDRTSATLITNLENLTITQVAAGLYHNVLLDSEGTAHTCGYGHAGQLGNGESGSTAIEYDPYQVTNVSPVKKVQCTQYTTFFLLEDSSLFSVGRNRYGEMGANLAMGSTQYSTTFQHVLDDVKDVFCGGLSRSCFVLQENNVLSAFGRNDVGQLGVGDNMHKNVPTLVNLTGINLVANGHFHTHFLRQEEPEYIVTDVGLDQDTFLDRNPGVKPRLDITGGAKGTDEAAVEFWRAPLSRMYDAADTDSRIVVRFYGVNKADGKCDKTKLVGSWVSGGSDVPDESETYELTGADTPWMTGTIQDKMDINGTSVSDSGYASDDDGKTRIPMLLKINILKSLIGPANPLWHGETADSVSVGDFKVCANIQVEKHLDTDATDGADTWVALLWRDFLVFLGVDLEDNVFTIGNETGEGIQVTIDAVENATSTYEKPELAFYQCLGQDNFNFDRRTPIDADVAQNGLVQMCLMPKSDDVYICEVDIEVDVNGIEETMQRVSKKELVAEGSDPAGTPDQSSIVSLYDREYVNCTFGPNGCDVQKVDIQTLASQAGNFLNITGTVTYCFRNEGTSGGGGRRLEKVPFDLSTAQRLRSLQAGGADEGAGAEPFSVSLKIDKIAYDGDEVSDMYVEGDVTMNNGGDNLGIYSAAAGAPSGGFFKILSVVVGVSAVFLFE